MLALARVLGPSQLVPFVRGAPLMQRVDLIAPARHAWPVAAGAVRMREQPSRRGRRAVPCLRMLVIGVGSAVSTSVGALMLAWSYRFTLSAILAPTGNTQRVTRVSG